MHSPRLPAVGQANIPVTPVAQLSLQSMPLDERRLLYFLLSFSRHHARTQALPGEKYALPKRIRGNTQVVRKILAGLHRIIRRRQIIALKQSCLGTGQLLQAPFHAVDLFLLTLSGQMSRNVMPKQLIEDEQVRLFRTLLLGYMPCYTQRKSVSRRDLDSLRDAMRKPVQHFVS